MVLNGQCLSWIDNQAGSTHGSLFFLIYINDLRDNITSKPRLFANDTLSFSVAVDPSALSNEINNDLHNMMSLPLKSEL